ncbi:hypothetical protein GCM10011506_29100 [Marivirga lumbricoides]|uniref:YbbR-like domain-containing protein n=1 Tax=Marivirga lumbricoides TaxID=1046115 RepID=A0ABQ1MP01_9BACT|nr:hypothetical protein GCM10011506_29100 [Marivirga lumbricoides]
MKIVEKILDGLSNTLLPSSNERLKVVVLCIVTATTFWFFNALNDSYTTRIKYPIEFIYPDSIYIPVKELPERVSINVSGGGWNLLRKTFGFKTEPLKIPLSEPASRNFILGSSLFSTISDQITEIQLNFIETDTLKIEIDSIRTKKARILIDSIGIQLSENYRITSPIQISPDSAQFTGPERFIKNIPDNVLVSLEDSQIKDNYSEEIELSTFGSSLVNRNPVEVRVQFKVERFINQELMIPYSTINRPADSSSYIFKDSLARLNFQIKETEASQFNLDSILLQVNYRNMSKKDSIVVPEIVNLPQVLKNKTIEVDSIHYFYQNK